MAEQPSKNKYEQGLGKNAANFTPLTPLSFIERTARVFPDQTAVIHGDMQRSWAETYRRSVKLAAALHNKGIGKGDTVAMMLPNVPAALEAHFGVPMCGAVLNALNIRLDAKTSFINPNLLASEASINSPKRSISMECFLAMVLDTGTNGV